MQYGTGPQRNTEKLHKLPSLKEFKFDKYATDTAARILSYLENVAIPVFCYV